MFKAKSNIMHSNVVTLWNVCTHVKLRG